MRWLWERPGEPRTRGYDPEGYRVPVPLRERLRLAFRAAAIVGAYLWFRARAADGEHEGAAAAAALGAALVMVGIYELFVTSKSTDRDRIFAKSKRQAMTALAAMVATGAVLVAGGLLSGA